MIRHGRNPSEAEIQKEIVQMVKEVAKDAEPSLRQQRDKENRKRQERRLKQMQGKEKPKRGRPKQTGPDCLRTRMIEVLRGGIQSVAVLSETLGADYKTVYSQMTRLKKEGLVVSPLRGVYALAGATVQAPAVSKAPAATNPVEAIPEPAQAITVSALDPLQQAIDAAKAKLKPGTSKLDIETAMNRAFHDITTEYFALRSDLDAGDFEEFRAKWYGVPFTPKPKPNGDVFNSDMRGITGGVREMNDISALDYRSPMKEVAASVFASAYSTWMVSDDTPSWMKKGR
jgi:biotin operon repressor